MVCHVVNKEQNTGISTARNSVSRERERERESSVDALNGLIENHNSAIFTSLAHWTRSSSNGQYL